MKKILLGIALSAFIVQGCKKSNDDVDDTVVLTVDEQNTYDDEAALKFMDDHYFNSKGLIVAFDSTIDTDDNYPKLSSYPNEKLPSGVICIHRTEAEPNPGKEIVSDDIISLFQVTKTYNSAKTNGIISFGSVSTFSNSVEGSGVPIKDPAYFYVKNSVIKKYNDANSTSVGRSFFEIEGLQEGLQKFKAFDMNDSDEYNMQGVIIVPSRAAFARDSNFYGYTNKSFIFNFQIYKTKTRVKPDED